MLKLIRNRFVPEGIFGELLDAAGEHFCYTLEHSYDNRPKLPDGTYTCVKGQHRLSHMTKDFTTFEITGVKGHSGILFHGGNTNKDSDGCVLVGMVEMDDSIRQSRTAFAKLMQSLGLTDSFELVVTSE